jgi:hypothetical protein
MTSLVCVYYTINDETIDSFDNNLQIKKMAILEADVEAHSFFLNKQVENTQRYTQSLKILSEIASLKPEEISAHSILRSNELPKGSEI